MALKLLQTFRLKCFSTKEARNEANYKVEIHPNEFVTIKSKTFLMLQNKLIVKGQNYLERQHVSIFVRFI
jgi:hypothetical protein